MDAVVVILIVGLFVAFVVGVIRARRMGARRVGTGEVDLSSSWWIGDASSATPHESSNHGDAHHDACHHGDTGSHHGGCDGGHDVGGFDGGHHGGGFDGGSFGGGHH